MKCRVLIEPPAVVDLDRAFEWIAGHSPKEAGRWYSQVLDAIKTLEKSPERCALAPESSVFEIEVRQLLFGRHPGR